MNSPTGRARADRAGDFPPERLVDIVVIGGGPAGSATAIALAGFGWSVTILERSDYGSTRIGETLPPEIKQPLIALGVWTRFLADGPTESPGIVASWGQPELYDNDFIVNPHGHGWHVDRRRFDLMLANAAAASGVELLLDARQISIVPSASAGWHVRAWANDRRVERLAPMLVDAAGRSASPARHLAGRRIVSDRLVGLVGFTGAEGYAGDRRTVIEAVECGWWYSAPLPDGNQVAVFMSDGDLLPAGQAARAAFWQDQLWQSTHARARIGASASDTNPRVVAACSARSPVVAGGNWLAVGDAAAAFDPLSSQGLAWALESGLMAAAAIDEHLRGDQTALPAYASQVESEFIQYLEMRAHYYGRERRWPDSTFWQRRHASLRTQHSPPVTSFKEKSGKSRKAIHCRPYLH
jgi:flavin-dependent dehydrogenase